MIPEDLQTQAALYALDALPADEASAFRAQLAGNPELTALVAEYEVAAAALAESAPAITPPSHLRGNILAAIAPKRSAIEPPRIPWLPWALAAGFAFATGVLWMRNDQLRTGNHGQFEAWTGLNLDLQAAKIADAKKGQEITTLTKQLAGLRTSDAGKAIEIAGLHKTVEDLENRNAIAEMQVATLTSKLDGSYLASIAWDTNSQEGVLHVRRLPEAGSGKDYQLWVIDPKYKVPVSAGIFKVQPDGSATIRFAPTQRISQAAAFAVSVEKTGGSASPEGPIVLSN